MKIERFLALWDVLRHFKDVFAVAIWSLIPGLNLLTVSMYVYGKLERLPKDHSAHIRNNFYAAEEEPLKGTKEYWSQWWVQGFLSIVYLAEAYIVNTLFFAKAVIIFPNILVAGDVPAYVQWACLAVALWVFGYTIKVSFGLLHGIWTNYRQLDLVHHSIPLDDHYLKRRAEATAARAKTPVPV